MKESCGFPKPWLGPLYPLTTRLAPADLFLLVGSGWKFIPCIFQHHCPLKVSVDPIITIESLDCLSVILIRRVKGSPTVPSGSLPPIVQVSGWMSLEHAPRKMLMRSNRVCGSVFQTTLASSMSLTQ